jgi:hypothetical protein
MHSRKRFARGFLSFAFFLLLKSPSPTSSSYRSFQIISFKRERQTDRQRDGERENSLHPALLLVESPILFFLCAFFRDPRRKTTSSLLKEEGKFFFSFSLNLSLFFPERLL